MSSNRSLPYLSFKRGVIAATVFCASGLALTAQNSSSPHGTVGGTCTFTQQVGPAGTGTKAQIATSLQTLINTLNTGSNYTTADARDLTNGSLANLTINGTGAANKSLALLWVKEAFASLDPNNNVWFEVDKHVSDNDANADEFTMLGLGVLMASGKLTLTDINNDTSTTDGITDAALVTNIAKVLGVMPAHTAPGSPTVSVDYTNIYLMNTTSRILMDQYLVGQGYSSTNKFNGTYDPATDLTTAEGQMVTYLNEIKSVGIHEFDAPTYSGTQLESLVEGFRYATDANTKLNYTTALDYLWLDLATDWHQGSLRIAPPFSRNYNFLKAVGLTQVWIEAIGCWTSGDPYSSPATGTQLMKNVVLEHAELYDILNSSHGYQLPVSTYALATLQGSSVANTHTVYANWGADAAGELPVKVANLGNNTTFGCTPGHYGPQDTLVGGSLKGDLTNAVNNLAQTLITAVLDSSGSPYGTIQYPSGEHSKTEHLQENVACALTGNVALVTFNIDGALREDAPADTGLSTNILFPANVNNLGDTTLPTTAINGTAISALNCPLANSNGTTNTLQYCALHMNTDVVTFKGINGGVIGVKFVESGWTDPAMNLSPQSAYQLEIDKSGSTANPTGASNAAGRIVVTHTNQSLTQNPNPSAQFMVAFLVALDDAATSPTNVVNILKNASFSDNVGHGDPSMRVLQATFNPSYLPTDVLGNSVQGLQVIRSTATLTNIGTPSKNIGSGYVSSLPALGSADTLFTIDGSYNQVSQSAAFWAMSNHAILNPGP